MTSFYESEIRGLAEWTFEKQPLSSLQNLSDQLFFYELQGKKYVTNAW